MIAASRDLTDFVIRQQVLKDPRVTVRPLCRVTSLLGDSGRITGVRLRTSDGTESERAADLVIDASGRTTRTPMWLADLGISGFDRGPHRFRPCGHHGLSPSKEPAEFESYARNLRHPIVADLLARAVPITDVTVTHNTTNQRHYYEGLKNWPEG